MRRLIVALLWLGFCGTAHATLLDGKMLGFAVHFPTITDTPPDPLNQNYLVGPGNEIVAPGVNGNFSDTNLRGDWSINSTYITAEFVGWEFFDALGDIDPFLSVTLNPDTNMVGLDSSRITFDANHIWVNLSGLSVRPGTVVSIDINAPGSAVPEPGSWGLAIGALAILSVTRRRRLR